MLSDDPMKCKLKSEVRGSSACADVPGEVLQKVNP